MKRKEYEAAKREGNGVERGMRIEMHGKASYGNCGYTLFCAAEFYLFNIVTSTDAACFYRRHSYYHPNH
jgi:hypothetical protein